MSFESPQEQENNQERPENKTYECPTGTFTIEHGEVGENGESIVKDIIFKQERDIDGADLEKMVSISLKEYLPEGWSFLEGRMFGSDSENKRIKFPEGGPELDKFLTVMLHEIGHANSYERHKKQGTLAEYTENTPANERDAWAYALRQIRFLIKQGIVAEKIWDNREDLTNLVYTALSTYGKNYGEDRLIKGKNFKRISIKDIKAVDGAQFSKNIAAVSEMMREHKRDHEERLRNLKLKQEAQQKEKLAKGL